jgi:hypothetical protein
LLPPKDICQLFGDVWWGERGVGTIAEERRLLPEPEERTITSKEGYYFSVLVRVEKLGSLVEPLGGNRSRPIEFVKCLKGFVSDILSLK